MPVSSLTFEISNRQKESGLEVSSARSGRRTAVLEYDVCKRFDIRGLDTA
jgi:hypothetical protein